MFFWLCYFEKCVHVIHLKTHLMFSCFNNTFTYVRLKNSLLLCLGCTWTLRIDFSQQANKLVRSCACMKGNISHGIYTQLLWLASIFDTVLLYTLFWSRIFLINSCRYTLPSQSVPPVPYHQTMEQLYTPGCETHELILLTPMSCSRTNFIYFNKPLFKKWQKCYLVSW